MLRISLRSLLAHKLRLALTATAVVLGVAFASGMLMLTSALDRTFVDIFESGAQDVLISPRAAVETDLGGPGAEPPLLLLGQEVVEQVAAVPGVAAAAGGISRNGAFLLDASGNVVGAAGPPALGVDWSAQESLNPASIVAGRPPQAPDEVVVDEATFPKLGIDIGSALRVITPQGEVATRLVGTFRFGETGGLAGATVTAFTPPRAQELFAAAGQWQFVSAATAEGFSDEDVAEAVSDTLGDAYLVQTREQQVQESAAALRDGLAFLNYILLGFAGVSLFVAAFLISNTFSMLIAARGKEMALLRAIGATRGQVLRAVLTEAAVLGSVAAFVGAAVGYGLALLLKAGVGALGLDLTAGIEPTVASIVVALGLGFTVTVVSALAPALRAARIRPIEALREASRGHDRPSVLVTLLGVATLVTSAILLGAAFWVDEPSIVRTATGAVLLLLAGILLAPVLALLFSRLATPVLSAVGGVPGRIAGRNAGRSPRRAAATASALIVGLSLVTGVTVVVASVQQSIERLVDDNFGAELVVSTPAGQPFAPSIAESMREIDGVAHVVSSAAGAAQLGAARIGITAIGGGPLQSVFTLEAIEGDLAALGAGRAVVDAGFAAENGLAMGADVSLLFPSGEQRSFSIAALYEPNALLSGVVIDLQDYRSVGGAPQDTLLFVTLGTGADPATVVPQVEQAAAVNPLLQVSDQTAVKEQNTAALNQLLYIIYAMLGLSIVIAALGVVNTMVLSVVERTREIGMLRALGASARQVRRMIRWEAVQVCLLGGLVGVALGILAAAALQRSLASSGIAELVIPSGSIIVLLAAALLIGVAGAAFPARRAARLRILDAIATE